MVATSQAAAAPATDERRSAPFTFLDREIHLYEPSTGQSYILLTVLNLSDESATQMEQINTVRTFGVMLGSLFVEQADLNYVMGTMARGGEVTDFLDLAIQMAKHWDIEEPEEPANRTERRAAERRPAAARPGRATPAPRKR